MCKVFKPHTKKYIHTVRIKCGRAVKILTQNYENGKFVYYSYTLRFFNEFLKCIPVSDVMPCPTRPGSVRLCQRNGSQHYRKHICNNTHIMTRRRKEKKKKQQQQKIEYTRMKWKTMKMRVTENKRHHNNNNKKSHTTHYNPTIPIAIFEKERNQTNAPKTMLKRL